MTGQVVDTDKYKYDRVKVRGPDGKAHYTASCKDAIAKSLFGMTPRQLEQVAKQNNLDMRLHAKTRNKGHYRMILGQWLRSLIVHKKQPVTINGAVIKRLDQKVKWPEGYAEEPKGTHEHPIIRKAKKNK